MVEAAAIHAGLRVVADHPTVVPHTFMGWDPKSVERLPNGHGELFPAFLTWRDASDKRVIDLMRPLFAAGLRPEVNCCVCVILVFCLPLNSWYSSTEVFSVVLGDVFHFMDRVRACLTTLQVVRQSAGRFRILRSSDRHQMKTTAVQ